MRILAISQVYTPDHSAVSQLLTQLLEDLAGQGANVSVIASRGRYLGEGRLPERETLRGVRVIRAWGTSLGKGSIARRLSDYGTFWATAITRAAVETRPNVMLALTTPPMIATGVLGVSILRRLPFCIWVQDVYPDLPIKLGMLRTRSLATGGLAALQRHTYRRAARIVALSNGMARRIEQGGGSPERIRVVPNWADGRALFPRPSTDGTFRQRHNLSDRFIVMYSGNLGAGHDVLTFVQAARLLAATRPEVVLVFVGEGVRKREAEAAARDLPNVRFLPYQPDETLGESLASADIHLVSLREDLEGLLVPSKLYAALAVGRPVMFVGPADCEVARVVRTHDLGWTGRPGDGTALAAAITDAAASPGWCAERGARARAAFEERYDRPVATRAWSEVLSEAASVGGQHDR